MRYHNITKDDMNNGDGLRVVLWVAGCEHHCKGCQNPVTWDPNGGIEFDEAAKKEIFDQLDKDYISGITFSGGDPLATYNRYGVTEFCREIREKYPNKTIWLYTGYTLEEISILPIVTEKLVDVLIDGRYVEELRDVNLHWIGSSNQKIINLKEGTVTKNISTEIDENYKSSEQHCCCD